MNIEMNEKEKQEKENRSNKYSFLDILLHFPSLITLIIYR
jgi:hypothetical protein